MHSNHPTHEPRICKRRRHRSIAWAAGIAIACPTRAADRLETVYYDFVDENGNLRGGRVELLLPGPDAWRGVIPAPCTTLLFNGPSSNRIDMVVVGDGYLNPQLAAYAAHTNNWINAFVAQQPFLAYSTFFNIHRVDVVSPESGVDHDPTYPIWRDTALGMGFWCSNIERLLCVTVGQAYAYAENAPDVDAVIAVANSTKYGGAGYTASDLATLSGGNSLAGEIAIHELGHSLGNLADEYDYADGTTYTGPEPIEPNASKLTAAQMTASGSKWATWIGFNNAAFDGNHSTYQGCRYYQFGVYRPTNSSKMRALGRPFNAVSVESLVIEMYKIVRPIDDSTPTGAPLNGSETVWADVVQPADHNLTMRWLLDGFVVTGATGPALDLGTVEMDEGVHMLRFEARDDTPWVRNEAARMQWMQDSRTWSIVLDFAVGDANCDGAVNVLDINPFVLAIGDEAAYLDQYPGCDILNCDANGDGTADVLDVNAFVALLQG
ncbi:IgA Peptidase M64 [Phycisphaerae bacterium RAS1]|nr:IgA Peptidase M64 [Phycisphaerae bacterium RAS1]